MFISKLTLRPDSGAPVWKMFRNTYETHRTVWNLFEKQPDASRDFVYRMDVEHQSPRILMVSERMPAPAASIWKVQTKAYDPDLKEGQRLGFILRANPVVTRDGKRYDVVMDAKFAFKQASAAEEDAPSMAEFVQEAGQKWLLKRCESMGVEINPDHILVDRYSIQEFRKPQKQRAIKIATCDFEGALTIADPEKFKQVLHKGIGKSRGFGCGLMMVRPL